MRGYARGRHRKLTAAHVRRSGLAEADDVGVGAAGRRLLDHRVGRARHEHLERRRLVHRGLQERPAQLHLVRRQRAPVGADVLPLGGEDEEVGLVDGPGDPTRGRSPGGRRARRGGRGRRVARAVGGRRVPPRGGGGGGSRRALPRRWPPRGCDDGDRPPSPRTTARVPPASATRPAPREATGRPVALAARAEPEPQAGSTSDASPARRRLEIADAGPLLLLSRMPKWIVPAVLALLLVAGLAIQESVVGTVPRPGRAVPRLAARAHLARAPHPGAPHAPRGRAAGRRRGDRPSSSPSSETDEHGFDNHVHLDPD